MAVVGFLPIGERFRGGGLLDTPLLPRHMCGVCSNDLGTQAALGPRIVKAHLLDALDCGEGGSSSPVLRLRGLDGKIFDKAGVW